MCNSCPNLEQAYLADMQPARARLLERLAREGLVMRVRKLKGIDRTGLRAALCAGEVALEPALLGMRVGMTSVGYDRWLSSRLANV